MKGQAFPPNLQPLTNILMFFQALSFLSQASGKQHARSKEKHLAVDETGEAAAPRMWCRLLSVMKAYWSLAARVSLFYLKVHVHIWSDILWPRRTFASSSRDLQRPPFATSLQHSLSRPPLGHTRALKRRRQLMTVTRIPTRSTDATLANASQTLWKSATDTNARPPAHPQTITPLNGNPFAFSNACLKRLRAVMSSGRTWKFH